MKIIIVMTKDHDKYHDDSHRGIVKANTQSSRACWQEDHCKSQCPCDCSSDLVNLTLLLLLLLFSTSSMSGPITVMVKVTENQAKDGSSHLVFEAPRCCCQPTSVLGPSISWASISLGFSVFLSHLHSLSLLGQTSPMGHATTIIPCSPWPAAHYCFIPGSHW